MPRGQNRKEGDRNRNPYHIYSRDSCWRLPPILPIGALLIRGRNKLFKISSWSCFKSSLRCTLYNVHTIHASVKCFLYSGIPLICVKRNHVTQLETGAPKRVITSKSWGSLYQFTEPLHILRCPALIRHLWSGELLTRD